LAKKKKKVKKRPVREYDLENALLRMEDRLGNIIEYSFNGLRPDVVIKLAMIGAGSLLCKKDNPLAYFELIRQNRFGRERAYKDIPVVVRAYAVEAKLHIDKAMLDWKKMDKNARLELRSNPLIKRRLLLMKVEALDVEINPDPDTA